MPRNSEERELDDCLRTRDVIYVRGVQQRGECGALRNSNQSFSRCAILMPEGEVSVRWVLMDNKDEMMWDL
ncbi:hypothetical protein EVAR_22851_1 [Eumeta japonica]|uniref:Uncharacterized protein n=1 Tax=Eumeta variegata TaxID=151549 RepID=A0A4C1VFH8_EUMVA|nr:hypothetical protein EVAR_22851_1 [Eumeta japonica]